MNPLAAWIFLLSCASMKGGAGALKCYVCDDCIVDTTIEPCPSDDVTVAAPLPTSTRPMESTLGVPGDDVEVMNGPEEAGELEQEPEPTEAMLPEAEPGEAQTGEAQTGEADPGEAGPAEGEPAKAEPAEAEPAEADPAEAEAAEAEPVEVEADASEPVEGETAELQSLSLTLSADVLSNLNLSRRKRQSTDTPVSYHCFSLKRNDGKRRRIMQGCIAVQGNASACDILKETHRAMDGTCSICSEDKCNSGVVLRLSLAAALLVVVISLLQW